MNTRRRSRPRLRPTPNTHPWRRVLDNPEPTLSGGRGSVLGPDTSRRTHWWELHLECGHRTERTVRYGPRSDGLPRRVGGTQHRSMADVLPPPKRVRCEFCPTPRKRDTMATVPPGRALNCEQCDEITPASQLGADPADGDECPRCGGDLTMAVDVSPCPAPSGECGDEDHHFGVGMHVREVNL